MNIKARLNKLEQQSCREDDDEKLKVAKAFLEGILGDEHRAVIRCLHPDQPDDAWADRIVSGLGWDRGKDLRFAILPGLEPRPVVMVTPGKMRTKTADERQTIEAADCNDRILIGFINGSHQGGAGRVTVQDWQEAIGRPAEQFEAMIAHIEAEGRKRNAA
jgi:hypothetical protein